MGEEEVAQKLLMEAMKKAKNLKNPAAYEKKMEKKRLLKKEEEQRKELEVNLDKAEQIGEKVIDEAMEAPIDDDDQKTSETHITDGAIESIANKIAEKFGYGAKKEEEEEGVDKKD